MEGSGGEVVHYIHVNKVMDTDPIEQNIRYYNMAFLGNLLMTPLNMDLWGKVTLEGPSQ